MNERIVPLLKKLRSENPKTSKRAAAALEAMAVQNAGAFHQANVLPLLIEMMDFGPNWAVRQTVCRVLDKTAPKQIVARLTQDLVSDAPKTRREAVNRFGRIVETLWPALVRETKKQAMPVLLQAAAASERGLRSQAIAILGRLRHYDAIPLLIQSLDDEDEWVRGDAAQALGAMGPKAGSAAVPDLIKALDDGATNLYAVIALGKIGAASFAALPRLKKLMETGDDEMNEEAETAIKRITRLEKARVTRLKSKVQEKTT